MNEKINANISKFKSQFKNEIINCKKEINVVMNKNMLYDIALDEVRKEFNSIKDNSNVFEVEPEIISVKNESVDDEWNDFINYFRKCGYNVDNVKKKSMEEVYDDLEKLSKDIKERSSGLRNESKESCKENKVDKMISEVNKIINTDNNETEVGNVENNVIKIDKEKEKIYDLVEYNCNDDVAIVENISVKDDTENNNAVIEAKNKYIENKMVNANKDDIEMCDMNNVIEKKTDDNINNYNDSNLSKSTH